MIKVPDNIKDLFRMDSVRKNFRVHFQNGDHSDIINDQILFESVSLTESLCSEEGFKFGMMESPVLEFEAVGIGDITGKEISAQIEIDVSSLDFSETFENLNRITFDKRNTELTFTIRAYGEDGNEIIGDYAEYEAFYDGIAYRFIGAKALPAEVKFYTCDFNDVKTEAYGYQAYPLNYGISNITFSVRNVPGIRYTVEVSPITLFKEYYDGIFIYPIEVSTKIDTGMLSYSVPYGEFIVQECARDSIWNERYKVIAYGKNGFASYNQFVSPMLEYKYEYEFSETSYKVEDVLPLEVYPEILQDLFVQKKQDICNYAEWTTVANASFTSDLKVMVGDIDDPESLEEYPIEIQVSCVRFTSIQELKYLFYAESEWLADSYFDYLRKMNMQEYTEHDGYVKKTYDGSGTEYHFRVDELSKYKGLFFYHIYNTFGTLTDQIGSAFFKLASANSGYCYPRIFTAEEAAEDYLEWKGYVDRPGVLSSYQNIVCGIFVPTAAYFYDRNNVRHDISTLHSSVKFSRVTNNGADYYKMFMMLPKAYTTINGATLNCYSVDMAHNNVMNYPQIVGSYLEFLGLNAKYSRTGGFDLFDVDAHKNLYPSETLYPSELLFPQGGETIKQSMYSSLEWKVEPVKPYGKVRISFENEDGKARNIEQIFVDDFSDDKYQIYDLTENYIITNAKEIDLGASVITDKSIINDMLPNLARQFNNLSYQPAEIEMVGLPFLEVGDFLDVKFKNTGIQTMVMKRVLKGIQHLRDQIGV